MFILSLCHLTHLSDINAKGHCGGLSSYTPLQVSGFHKHYLYPDATHVPPESVTLLSKLRSTERFRQRLAFHASRPSITPDFLRALPYSALETSSAKQYLRQGEDYVAYCIAHGIPFLPVNFQSLTAYFTDWVHRGHTSRSFGALATKIKWYITNILFGEWIDSTDPIGYKAWLQARKALSEADPSLVTKKAPLTLRILEEINLKLPNDIFNSMIFTIFSMQHATMQRLGELLNGVALVKHLRHITTPKGGVFIFLYLFSNRPKMHKMKQAPYAIISKCNRPLVYRALTKFLQVFHTNSISTDYLFPHVTRSNTILRHRALSSSTAIKALGELLKMIGLDASKFGGHSARRGGFCDSLHIPLHFSQTQGHWTLGSLTTMTEYGHQSLASRMLYF